MKRKQYLINPKFQLRFISVLMLSSLVVLVVFYSSNLYFLNLYMQSGKKVGLPPGHVFFTFLKDQYEQMNAIFWITAILVSGGNLIFGLFYSHRIAGPIYRLRQHMDKISKNRKPSDIRFREHDLFKELEESYNRHIAAIAKDTRE